MISFELGLVVILLQSYNGLFQHRVYANFPSAVTEHLMERMGFIYDHSDQTFTFYKQTWPSGTWQQSLSQAGMEFFLIFVYCAVVSNYNDAVTLPTKTISELDGSKHGKKKMIANKSGRSDKLLRSEDLKPHESNHYVTVDEMRRHNQVSGGEKVVAVSSRRYSSHDDIKTLRKIDDVNIPSFDSFDDKVRYPPQFSASGPEKKSKIRQKKSTPQSSYLFDNYVEAQPMSHFPGVGRGNLPSRDSRIESGYYSEWALNKLGRSDEDKAVRSGDYVYALPPNRPPGDGEPMSSLPKYHEILQPPRDRKNYSLRH